MKKGIYTILLALLVLLGGCSRKVESRRLMPIPVEIQVIGESMESASQNYVGMVEANSSTSLSFAVAGNVTRVYVREGQKVAAGTLLAQVDESTYRQSHDAAVATLRQAQDGYDRLKQLHDKGTISEVQWVEMETKLAQAVSTEAIARRNLENCQLTAPFSGVVGQVNVAEGANVMPGMTALTLLQTHGMQVTVPIPENRISDIRVGQPAQITVSALDNRTFDGKVASKGVVANPLSHNYDITIPLPNADASLMPGMVCSVSLPSADTAQIIVLPNRVVKMENGQHFVWMASNGKAVRRAVVTGGLAQRGIIITDGLQPGDSVIVNGEQKVSTGSSITIR